MMTTSYSYDAASAGMLIYSLIMLVIAVIAIIALWKIFDKAGKPGWGAIIPFYNLYLLYDIAFGSGWFFLLSFIPFVNAIISIILMFKLAKSFGKGVGFGFGLLFLYPIFMLILAFGNSEYVGA